MVRVRVRDRDRGRVGGIVGYQKEPPVIWHLSVTWPTIVLK